MLALNDAAGAGRLDVDWLDQSRTRVAAAAAVFRNLLGDQEPPDDLARHVVVDLAS